MGELPPKLLDLWMRLELLMLVLHTNYNLDPLIQCWFNVITIY